MSSLDTGICAPESEDTLLLQQRQLLRGTRIAQMFTVGTIELPVPEGFARHVNERGVFHYNPFAISENDIDLISLSGSENLILNLGPYNKSDIARRAHQGEAVTCISEYSKDGVEIRSAAASSGTINEQYDYFEKTKEPDSLIKVGVLPQRVLNKGK